MAKIDVKVPDIGDFKDVPVIEVLVKPGDVVKVDQSLITLESDKATMDVPSPVAGAVAEIVAKVGDKVSMGTLIARVDSAANETAQASDAPGKGASSPAALLPPPRRLRPPRRTRPLPARKAAAAPAAKPAPQAPAKAATIDITIPDIGDFKDVPIIEILVKAGDTVEAEQPIVTLESDKATMDVPSPAAGKITGDCRQGRRQGVDGLADREARRRRTGCADLVGAGGRGGREGRGGRRRSARNLARRAERSAAPAAKASAGPALSPISPGSTPVPPFAGSRASSASTSI